MFEPEMKAIYENQLFLEEEMLKHKIKQSLHSLTPDYTEPDNLETKTQPELIELLITAAKYWREQAES